MILYHSDRHSACRLFCLLLALSILRCGCFAFSDITRVFQTRRRGSVSRRASLCVENPVGWSITLGAGLGVWRGRNKPSVVEGSLTPTRCARASRYHCCVYLPHSTADTFPVPFPSSTSIPSLFLDNGNPSLLLVLESIPVLSDFVQEYWCWNRSLFYETWCWNRSLFYDTWCWNRSLFYETWCWNRSLFYETWCWNRSLFYQPW